MSVDTNMLLRELETAKLIHKQIAKLNTEKDWSRAIQETLACIGAHLGVRRAYIFEAAGEDYRNTFEWHAGDVCAPKETFGQVPGEALAPWMERLEAGECVVVDETDPSCAYGILTESGNAVEVPISVGGKLLGLIGMNGIPAGEAELTADSLKVLGTLLGTMLRNLREQEILRQSRDMQREMVGSLSCGVLAYSVPQYHVLTINAEAKRIVGFEEHDTVPQTLKRFMNERILSEDRPRADLSRLQKPGDCIQTQLRLRDRGRLLTIKATVKLLVFANGQQYILCSMQDLTEQAELAHSLAMERKSYREALENGSEFAFFFDLTEGQLHQEFWTAHNVNLIRMLGMTVPVGFDELMQRYVETDGVEFVREDMARNFTCKGLLEDFANGRTNVMTEFYSPVRDLYIRTNCLMSLDDLTGHVHASVVATDITEMRRMERARQEMLRNANDEMTIRLDTILNGISGGLKIVNADDDYRYNYISEGAARLQGYTVAEFLERFGGSVFSNICEEDREQTLADANRQIAEKGAYKIKYRIEHKDGGIRWVIDRGKLVTDPSNGKKYFYILMQDVTELEERNAQIGKMLSMQREMAGALGNGILAYTLPERRILLMNDEACRIFGRTKLDELNGDMDLMNRIIPSDLPQVRRETRKLAHIGDSISYTFHCQEPDGSLSAYLCHTKLLSFEDGQQYILSSISDMTGQERQEKLIDEERRQYRNALVFGSQAFFSIDLTDGVLDHHIIAKNGKNLTAALGLTVPIDYDELMSAWFAKGRVESTSFEIERIRRRSRIMESCRTGASPIDFEYHVPSTGQYFHVMVLLDNIGNRPRASFILYDISDDRQQQQQRLSVIESLGQIYSGLYLFSLRTDTYVAYKQHEDVRSAFPEKGKLSELISVYTSRYVEPEFQETVAEFLCTESIRKRLQTTDHIGLEFRRRGLGWCQVSLVAAERDENGCVTAVVYAITVIDEQKQAELSQQAALRTAYEAANLANAAKTEFLSNMSHDIRTPMNAIIGMTAIADTHLDDRERVADCLSKIALSSRHLLGLINEVLDMSKIESGKMELQEENFRLPELVDNLLTMSRTAIEAKNHTLNVSIHGIEHERVIGDSQRIQQVFMNIMSNAIKYTPEGGTIQLSISEKPTNRQKVGCYEFIFEDNGIGMSEEFQKHLFEPFVRARDDARVGKIQGTGLGMPITRNIVQMLNGDIQVKSRLNEGTRVTITFFLKLEGEEDTIDYERFVDLPVLVADDDETSCEYTCALLQEIGMKGEWVLTGEEAVERTVAHHERNEDFFAVILDWKMPGMDGVETTREIRKRVGQDVPIIIISAFDWSDIELEARKAGASAFVSKPLFKSRVVHLFHELVSGERNEEANNAIHELSQEDFSGKHALLVEDNEINAEIAGEVLGMVGLTVDFAHDGKEAVDVMAEAEDNQYDIVFMDIQMPIMNGYEATRAIRALPGSYCKSVPIVAMTANAFADDVAEAKNAGMNEHMAKPIDFDQLLSVLRRWLS